MCVECQPLRERDYSNDLGQTMASEGVACKGVRFNVRILEIPAAYSLDERCAAARSMRSPRFIALRIASSAPPLRWRSASGERAIRAASAELS